MYPQTSITTSYIVIRLGKVSFEVAFKIIYEQTQAQTRLIKLHP